MLQNLSCSLLKIYSRCWNRNYSVLNCLCKKFFIFQPEFSKKISHRFYGISADSLSQDTSKFHIPVLAKEVVKALDLKENGFYLDMTFGAGGHTQVILEKCSNVFVYGLDRDPETKKFGDILKHKYPHQFHYMLGKFSDLPLLLREQGIQGNFFNGVLMDLGVSSMQFNTPSRGFMLSQNGPLDMRMDGTSDEIPTAAQILKYIDEDSLYRILKYYGQEKRARVIARGIVESRVLFKSLRTTKELAQLVESLVGGGVQSDKLDRYSHPATKTFQALRILVNDELNQLDFGIRLAHRYLQPSGILTAISFHSLEDTILKRHISGCDLDKTPDSIGKGIWKHRNNHLKTFSEREISEGILKPWKSLFKHVLVPNNEEVESNPRSRSAKMRVASKISCKFY